MADKIEIISSPSDIMLNVGETALSPSSPPPSRSEEDIISYIIKQVHVDSRREKPVLLLESAGKESCCIFRVPESFFIATNPEAYKPKVVSIGPYHYGEQHLEMIQQHKLRFLQLFIDKARKNGVDEHALIKAVMDLEKEIRKSYSEDLGESSEKLVYMMILDGCFILMLFLILDKKDPILTIPWILRSIKSDILLLENQVPFFVLQTLFDESNIGVPGDLNRMAFSFFNLSMDKPERYWEKHRYFKAKHLLDLIRMSFIPIDKYNDPELVADEFGKKTLITSATRLYLRGIDFCLRSDADSMLDIRLKKYKLQIPLLRLDGFISSILLNCFAFEQIYTKSTNHITSYIVFMGCLLNGEEDATFLSHDNRIIENYFSSENEVSQFFKTLCKDVMFDIHTSYLQNVFVEINENTSKWYSKCRRVLQSSSKFVAFPFYSIFLCYYRPLLRYFPNLARTTAKPHDGTS